MMPGSTFIRSKDVERYHRNRLLRFFLVATTLPEDGEVGELVRGSSALQAVAGRSGAEIVEHGSSFFWYHVDRLYDHLEHDREVSTVDLSLFLVQLFDSFFPLLEDSERVYLSDLTPDREVQLPCLGFRFASAKCRCLVRRSGARLVIGRNGEEVVLDLDSPGDHRLPAVDITPTASLLFSVESLLLDPLASGQIADLSAKERENFARMLREALDMIELACPAVREQIDEVIKWYFPIKTEDKHSVHNSFTISSLTGAIFLSEGYSCLPLAEALVHEYYHNELWMAMRADKHLAAYPEENLYSPWRDDARPLPGLYHGTYVFTGLLEFFAAGCRVPALRHHHVHFEARRRKIFHQVHTALGQIPSDKLMESGREYLARIKMIVQHHATALGANTTQVPESQMKHWKGWSERYPEFSRSAIPPTAVQVFDTSTPEKAHEI